MAKRILVTGGAGFIGSHLVDRLVERSDIEAVAVIDNFTTGLPENVSHHRKVTFYLVDLTDSLAVNKAVSDFQPGIIIHLAANPSVIESMKDPVATARSNVIATINILEAMRKHGVKTIIFAGSSGVEYGTPQWLPVTEDHPLLPLDAYGASKVACETYLNMYRLTYGFQVITVRLPNIYGPRQNPGGGCGVIAKFLEQMVNGQPIKINGDGSKVRDFLYVDDAVEGFTKALDVHDSTTVNLGTGRGTSVLEIFEALADATSYTVKPNFGPDKIGEIHTIYSDASLAKELLGWQPKVSLKEGLRRTVEWYQSRYGSKQNNPHEPMEMSMQLA